MTFQFRPVTAEDFPLLIAWRRRPHVMKWWGTKSADELHEEFVREMADPNSERYVVMVGRRDFAFVQVCEASVAGDGWWPDAIPGTWAIDYLIGEPDMVGKGIGTAIILEFTDLLLSRPGVHTVTADPEPGNIASIRACEKAGYSNTGEVDTPDGLSVLMVRTK